MKTVLVTGGAGFIGSHLVKRLLNLDYSVIVIDKVMPWTTLYDVSRVNFIQGDLSKPGLIEEVLEKVDVCFHLAGNAYNRLCSYEWLATHESDAHAFNTLLDVLRRMERKIKLIYASSADVYGDLVAIPFVETARTLPTSFKGVNALRNEIYAYLAQVNFNIQSIGLRLFNVYGKGWQYFSNTAVTVCFRNALLQNKPLVIYGDGNTVRDFVSVDDVVNAFIQASLFTETDSGIFNVCTGTPTSINSLALMILEVMNASLPIIHVEARENDCIKKIGSPNIAKHILGFGTKTALKEGLSAWLMESCGEYVNE